MDVHTTTMPAAFKYDFPCPALTILNHSKSLFPASLSGPVMSGNRHKSEQVVNLFRKIEVEIANGRTAALAAHEVGYLSRPASGGEGSQVV